MKMTFSEYVKANGWFIPTTIAIVLLWVAVAYNPDQIWLWVLVVAVTAVAIVGVIRNLAGKDGLWGG